MGMKKRKDMTKKQKKRYIPVIIIRGKRNTYMEFGIVENPTFDNDIYYKIISSHKGGSGQWEMRTDEALLYVQAFSACIRRKLTGVNLILRENQDEWRKIEKEIKKEIKRKIRRRLGEAAWEDGTIDENWEIIYKKITKDL